MKAKAIKFVVLVIILLLYITITLTGTSEPVPIVHLTFVLALLANVIWLTLEDFKTSVLKPILKILEGHNPKLKIIASTYTGLAAVIFLFFNTDIKKYSSSWWDWFINGPETHQYVIDVAGFFVAIYWFSFIAWLGVFTAYVFIEKDSNNKINNALHQAILRAPNQSIFANYTDIYNRITEKFNWLEYAIRQDKDVEKIYNESFRHALDLVVEFTKGFFPTARARYSANILIYISKTSETERIISTLSNNQEECIFFPKQSIDRYTGLLRSIPELTTETNGLRTHHITLPILVLPKQVLPGACQAAEEKGEAIINDTHDFELYADFGGNAVDKAKIWFGEKCKDVRSFVSISIPIYGIPQAMAEVDKEKKIPQILGILNIESSEKNILGEIDAYQTTYFSQLKPIAHQFSRFLDLYLQKFPITSKF